MHRDVFYLVGGLDSRDREPGDEMQPDPSDFNMRLFDFNTQIWTQIVAPHTPEACNGGAQLVALGDQLILFGGKGIIMHLLRECDRRAALEVLPTSVLS